VVPQAIANTPAEALPFEGIKVQLKGRMSGKGGKASKKVWVWGRTSSSNVADPVDYAHQAVVTRAGYIGIKVRCQVL
jgi:ribosomal protein S3